MDRERKRKRKPGGGRPSGTPARSRTSPEGSKQEAVVNAIRARSFAIEWGESTSKVQSDLLALVLEDDPDPVTWPKAFHHKYLTPFELERENALPLLPMNAPPLLRQQVELLIAIEAERRYEARKREYRKKRRQKQNGTRRGFPGPRKIISLVYVVVHRAECSGASCAANYCGCFERVAKRLGPELRVAEIETVCKRFHEGRVSGGRFADATEELLHYVGVIVFKEIGNSGAEARRLARHRRPDFTLPVVNGALSTIKKNR